MKRTNWPFHCATTLPRAFRKAFRSELAKDGVPWRRFYSVPLQGEPQRWVLILRQLDKPVSKQVEAIPALRTMGAR